MSRCCALDAADGAWKGAKQDALTATVDTAIEVGGTYTVLVSDANQTGAGTYRLHLARGSIAPPGTNVLTNGQWNHLFGNDRHRGY